MINFKTALLAGSACLAMTIGAHAQTAHTAAVRAATIKTASVGGEQIDPEDRFNVTGELVVIHKGSNMPLVHGENTIDGMRTVDCTDASGCTIKIESRTYIDGTGDAYRLCSLVDGSQIGPKCLLQATVFGTSMQSIIVAPGTHTIATEVYVDGTAGTLYTWIINYTIYARQAPPAH